MESVENIEKFESNLESLFDMVEETREFSLDDSPLIYELKKDEPRYISSEVIAFGGMKTISRVFDRKTGRYVAMAKLHKNTPPELFEPFLREARLTALLDHPNIISIYDIGLDSESAPYFTMELKSGQGLDELIKKRRDGEDVLNELLDIFLKVCDGVSYAHSQKVLHLDLKPENIQVGIYGEVIICDWGLGKLIGSPDYDSWEFDRMLLNPDLLNNMTRADEVRGTPGFMSPEQVKKKRVYKQSDIYALGAILYSILTGYPPIEGDVDDVLNRTRMGEIEPPKKRNKKCSVHPSLSAVTMKALAVNPRERYSSVAALRRDVHKFMTGYSTIAEKAGFVREFRLFYKRNSNISLVIFYALLFIGVLTMLFMNGLHENRLEAEFNQWQAVKEKERAERVFDLYRSHKEAVISDEYAKQMLADQNWESIIDHKDAVHELLKQYNPQWDNGTFMYNPAAKKLSLGGAGLSKLTVDSVTENAELQSIALLQTLEIDYLDLRNTEIYDLSEVSDLKLKKLDIRDTLINSCEGIVQHLPTLQVLIVSKDQLQDSNLLEKSSKIKLLIR